MISGEVGMRANWAVVGMEVEVEGSIMDSILASTASNQQYNVATTISECSQVMQSTSTQQQYAFDLKKLGSSPESCNRFRAHVPYFLWYVWSTYQASSFKYETSFIRPLL